MSHLSHQMPLEAALVGYGYVGKLFHAALIDATSGLHLQVIGSNQPDVVHAERPDTTVCTPEAAATHADVDLVVIVAPNDRHAPPAEVALRAGKRVVMDKLSTVTLAEARYLVRVARDTGRVLSVFQNRCWDSDFFAMQAAIGGGAPGEAIHAEAHFDRYRSQVCTRWCEQTGQGTGIWFDLGPHLIDQTLQLPGPSNAVSASFACQRSGAEAPDWMHVVLDVGEYRAVLHVNMLVVGGSPRRIVHGTRGSLVKRRMDQQEAQLLVGMKFGVQDWGVDNDAGVLIDGAISTETRVATPTSNQRAYHVAVHDAIFGQRANPVPPVQAVSAMAVLEAVAAAAETGTAVVPDLTDAERVGWLAVREIAP